MYGNNDGLEGIIETKIVWRAADNKWNDWGRGDDLMGVICKTSGNSTKTESQRVMGIYFLMSIIQNIFTFISIFRNEGKQTLKDHTHAP